MINKIFVYGTLMRGMMNHSFIKHGAIEKIEKAQIKGSLYNVRGVDFPAMVFENNEDITHGELIEICNADLIQVIGNCDKLEGHPTLYRRTIVEVLTEAGETCRAYTYEFMQHEYLDGKIASGKYTGKKRR